MATTVGTQGGAFNPDANYTLTGDITVSGSLTVTGTMTDTGSTLTSPTISGTVAGGATYTAPTFTTPVLGAATGTSLALTATTNQLATGASSNITTVNFPASSGAVTLTMPNTTDTLVGRATSDTLTNKTLTAPAINGGTATAVINADYKVLAANATYSATVTPATLTGFSWTVVAGVYIFELNLPATMTTNGGLTINFLLTTAVLTSIQYQSYAATASDNTTAVSTNGTTTTSGTKVFDDKTAAYTHVNVKGSMVVGTGGTFAWQGCQNTSAGAGDATIVALGSFAKLTRVS